MDAIAAGVPAAGGISTRPLLVRRAAVLGAGTMGSRIAGILANAGIPVLLLDMAPRDEKAPRNALAANAIAALVKAKPAALFEPRAAELITAGNFEDDLAALADCDWVVEAVAENLEVKAALLDRVVPHLGRDAALTTNTSGLPIAKIAATLPKHRERFFGTHFFNPPRYMRLLEIVPGEETDAGLCAAFAAFAGRTLGKQVVFARDRPNFIANRIGLHLMFRAGALMLEQGLTIEEIDALTGPAIGWPKTGTFRLMDLVGIDIAAHVAANFPAGAERGRFAELLDEMMRRGWLGDKAGQGFYKKVSRAGVETKEERLVLDPASLEYRPAVKPGLPSLELAANAPSVGERLKMLLAGDPARDKAARFLWPFLSEMWSYAAARIGEVCDDAAAIDNAMQAGFNWELGPFGMWDAAGVGWTTDRMKALGIPAGGRAEAMLAAGKTGWFGAGGQCCFQPATGEMEPVDTAEGHARVADFRRANGLVRGNAGASLIDLGGGIACIELHSMKNAIGGDVLTMLVSALDPGSEAVRDFDGFVIASDRDNFSVGANLFELLLAAQDEDWDEIASVIRGFQRATSAIKFCPRPVVAAPAGLALGGGAELCIHAARRQAHTETYIGLVEAGVGLIPAGGGTKEMLLKAVDQAAGIALPYPKDPPSKFAQSAELASTVKRAFETIALAKVSGSAAEARTMGMLTAADRITPNRERLLLDAKAQALALAGVGYAPPQPRLQVPAPGIGVLAALETGIGLMREAEYISAHDETVARSAAHVLCGGRLTAGTLVSEQYLLDLELEAFLSLCGRRKTQERIAHTLKTGKPLRN